MEHCEFDHDVIHRAAHNAAAPYDQRTCKNYPWAAAARIRYLEKRIGTQREPNTNIQFVEKLSLHEQFKLVEIAHETKDSEIRKAALAVLQKYLNPLVTMVPEDSR